MCLIKGTESGMACVPNTGSLADNSIILDSLKVSQLTCQDNPKVDGYYRCLASATIKNCPRDKKKGKLECQNIQPDFSNIAGGKKRYSVVVNANSNFLVDQSSLYNNHKVIYIRIKGCLYVM